MPLLRLLRFALRMSARYAALNALSGRRSVSTGPVRGFTYSVNVRGGNRFRAHMREMRRAVRAMNGKVIEVGFHDPRAAAIASIHEFGNHPSGVPARPAFSQAIPEMNRIFSRHFKRVRGLPTTADMERVAQELEDELKSSYLGFRGEPLSPRQEARKAGTPGQGQQLVGSEGPRLIAHISGRIGDGF